MVVFADLIPDIYELVDKASHYREVVVNCKQLVDQVRNPEWSSDNYNSLLDRVLGRAADRIAYSKNSNLEASGENNFDKVWSIVESTCLAEAVF